ncbi:hypothetical protein LINPERPRIM_LOCUS21579 [Linum perenne]
MEIEVKLSLPNAESHARFKTLISQSHLKPLTNATSSSTLPPPPYPLSEPSSVSDSLTNPAASFLSRLRLFWSTGSAGLRKTKRRSMPGWVGRAQMNRGSRGWLAASRERRRRLGRWVWPGEISWVGWVAG